MCGRGKKFDMSILRVFKPFVIGGAVAATMAVMPVAAAEASAGPVSAAPTHVIFHQEPGGAGCDANGNCGSGGQNGGPGGGPGGQGCVAGVGCGSGGQNAGPGGVPGGQGCVPGTNLCGSGHA
jgi:hypothetical protein